MCGTGVVRKDEFDHVLDKRLPLLDKALFLIFVRDHVMYLPDLHRLMRRRLVHRDGALDDTFDVQLSRRTMKWYHSDRGRKERRRRRD